jgi:uroporphyrinogen III methyltransferase/synthase
MTVRAVELLSATDVVVHDRLVDARVVRLAPVDAEIIDVGKRAGSPGWLQAEINAVLLDRGRRNLDVVRLKGGDPYVFGRGGEEAEALRAAGIDYDVVPGVSSATAAAVSAGVPLTMRGVASAFTVVTGHDVTDPHSSVAWESVARSRATIVIVMGGSSRSAIAERLIAAGLPGETPVLAVSSATHPSQRSVRATLQTLGAISLGPPVTLIVGEVAQLAFASYEDRALAGLRVVVTREVLADDPFGTALLRLGAEVIEFPTIAVVDPADGGAALEKAAGDASGYEWIVFSSKNAVDRFFRALRDVRGIGGAKIAAIGSATADALAQRGVIADLVPLRFVDEALVEEFVAADGGGRVLLPRAAGATAVLPLGLRALGWEVDAVEAYRTVTPPADPGLLERMVGADAITFLSSSAVTGFLALAGRESMPRIVASIGPVTSATLRDHGVAVDVEATVHTASGIVDALVAYVRGAR